MCGTALIYADMALKNTLGSPLQLNAQIAKTVRPAMAPGIRRKPSLARSLPCDASERAWELGVIN